VQAFERLLAVLGLDEFPAECCFENLFECGAFGGIVVGDQRGAAEEIFGEQGWVGSQLASTGRSAAKVFSAL